MPVPREVDDGMGICTHGRQVSMRARQRCDDAACVRVCCSAQVPCSASASTSGPVPADAAAAVSTPLLAVRAPHVHLTLPVCPVKCACQAAVLCQCASAVLRQCKQQRPGAGRRCCAVSTPYLQCAHRTCTLRCPYVPVSARAKQRCCATAQVPCCCGSVAWGCVC